ncbi:MAG: hypothetical protein Tsb0013_14820 [Phycisphaerales bacterium]
MSEGNARPRIQKGRGSLRRPAQRTAHRTADTPTHQQQTLAETLDRVLSRGIVVSGEVVISVAEIPLVYVGVQALVSSVEAAVQALEPGA